MTACVQSCVGTEVSVSSRERQRSLASSDELTCISSKRDRDTEEDREKGWCQSEDGVDTIARHFLLTNVCIYIIVPGCKHSVYGVKSSTNQSTISRKVFRNLLIYITREFNKCTQNVPIV